MARRAGPRKASCNAGELSSDLVARPDIKQYYAGGLQFKHVEPVPQTGFRLMAGSDRIAPVRGAITQLSNGGGVAAQTHSEPAVLATWNFAAVQVAGVSSVDLSADLDGFTYVLEVQTNVSGTATWEVVSSTFSGRKAATTRFAFFPPGITKAITGVRLRLVSVDASTVFNLGSLVTHVEGDAVAVRYCRLPVDDVTGYMLAVGPGYADIWNKTTWVACIALPAVTANILSALRFYAELSTVGIFAKPLQSLRIRRAGSDHEWGVDHWPFKDIPTHDYGGEYPKVNDKWSIFIRWADNPQILLQVTVNGEQTPTIGLKNGNGDIGPANEARIIDIEAFAAEVSAAIQSLPSFPGTVTYALGDGINNGRDGYFEIQLTFGGDASGQEFSLSSLITSSASASALPAHIQIGRTDAEPLFSAVRGWIAGATLAQDRQIYFDAGEERSAILKSRVGSYFDVNIDAAADSGALLSRPRGGQTSEVISAIVEARYVVIFTNRSIYFVNNRTISRNEPPNFVFVSDVGLAEGTMPVEIESQLYFCSDEDFDDGNDNPGQIYSMIYDEVAQNFTPVPESLLASHLVSNPKRTAAQAASGELDTPRMWMLREDGRLICGKMIRSQEILGLCEWLPADGGVVNDMAVDHFNQPWLCTTRNGQLVHERMNSRALLRDTVRPASDLSGRMTGLPYPDGAEVWCIADGYSEGPLTVQSGAITVSHPATAAEVGYWQPPVFEDMPHVMIGRNDEVIQRPGRIAVVHARVKDTTSIAVGANNTPPRDVILAETSDPMNVPTPPKSKTFTVDGLLGVVMHPTVKITQLRPGALRVLDYSVEERL